MNNSNIYWAWVDVSSDVVLRAARNLHGLMRQCLIVLFSHADTHAHPARQA